MQKLGPRELNARLPMDGTRYGREDVQRPNLVDWNRRSVTQRPGNLTDLFQCYTGQHC